MPTTQWIVANELGRSTDMHAFIQAIQAHPDAMLHTVGIEDCLTPSWTPSVDNDIPTIFYGPTNFVRRMKDAPYAPAVYGDDALYDYRNMTQHLPPEFFFNDPRETTIGTPAEILTAIEGHDPDHMVFFKPCSDNKLIIGQVRSLRQVADLCNAIAQGSIEGGDASTMLMMAPTHGIETEYRLFVVNGKVVSASTYSPHRTRAWPLDGHIEAFAQQVINTWVPSPCFVLDICLSNGRPYIMEIQNFHSAGFYEANPVAIVDALHTMIHAPST